MSEVIYEIVEDGVARITINRPEAMNAMSRAVRIALADALARSDTDDRVGAIIVTGAGDRAFSAGMDLKELGGNAEAIREVTSLDPRFNSSVAIEQCAKPIIGAINGVCVTGALELALCCDMLIASDNARFADTHARVGFLPAWGLSQRLSRLIGPGRAREMSLSCNFVDARTAEAWGLVNRVVPSNRLAEEALALARAIAAHHSSTTQATKALMKQGFAMPLGEALDYERRLADGYNAGVTPEMITERRKAIIGR